MSRDKYETVNFQDAPDIILKLLVKAQYDEEVRDYLEEIASPDFATRMIHIAGIFDRAGKGLFEDTENPELGVMDAVMIDMKNASVKVESGEEPSLNAFLSKYVCKFLQETCEDPHSVAYPYGPFIADDPMTYTNCPITIYMVYQAVDIVTTRCNGKAGKDRRPAITEFVHRALRESVAYEARAVAANIYNKKSLGQ